MATGIRDRLVDDEYLQQVRKHLERALRSCERTIDERPSQLKWDSMVQYKVELKLLLARLAYCEGVSVSEFRRSFVEAAELLLAAPEGSRIRTGFGGPLRLDIPALLSLFELGELSERLTPILSLGGIPRVADRRRVFDVLVGDERAWADENYPATGDRSEYPLPIHDLTFDLAAQCRADPVAARDDLYAFVDGVWLAGWTDADDPNDGNEVPRYPEWFFGSPPYPHYGPKASDARLYTGYWCFEAAAFAKRFGVDDSALAEHPYYPYDLVH